MSYRHDKMSLKEVLVTSVLKLNAAAETLAGTKTIVNEEGPVLSMDCGGSTRTVLLPLRALVNDGVILVLNNISTAGENFTIKDSTGVTTYLTLPSSGVAFAIAASAAEAPGTRAWTVVPIGGEDLALADDLAVTGDAAVTGNFTVSGNVALGDSSGDLLAFHGATATSQRSGAAGIAVTFTSLVVNSGSVSFTTWGFSTATAASALVTLVNEIRSALIEVGLMKGA